MSTFHIGRNARFSRSLNLNTTKLLIEINTNRRVTISNNILRQSIGASGEASKNERGPGRMLLALRRQSQRNYVFREPNARWTAASNNKREQLR